MMLFAGVNARMDDLRSEVVQVRTETRADIADLREPLRAVARHGVTTRGHRIVRDAS